MLNTTLNVDKDNLIEARSFRIESSKQLLMNRKWTSVY